MQTKTVLWLEDDAAILNKYKVSLALHGFDIVHAKSISAAQHWLEDNEQSKPALVMIDVHFPATVAKSEWTTGGIELALWIRRHPTLGSIPIMGESSFDSSHAVLEFRKIANAFLSKRAFEIPGRLLRAVSSLTSQTPAGIDKLNYFIVHGSNEVFRKEFVAFLKSEIGAPYPKVLMELPSAGKTIIEKFEEHAADADVAFILLSAEDTVAVENGENVTPTSYRQPRPNVLFEMGYFMARFGRLSGRVILLHQSGCSIATDLSGVVYVDVTNGVHSAKAQIQCELERILRDELISDRLTGRIA